MAYTRGQLQDLCRRRLGDLAVPYKWSDLQALDKTQQAESISATVHWVMNGWD